MNHPLTLRTEYFIILPSAESFCATSADFMKLLTIDHRITIDGNKLSTEKFTCNIDVKSGEIRDKSERYFQIDFVAIIEDNTELAIDNFTEMLRIVRSVISKAQDDKSQASPETLWDDISAYYSSIAYPIINDIENTLRKLIANFMLMNVGRGWINETAPKDFKEVLQKSQRQNRDNQLHQVDFIDLANFLLKPYARKTPEQLYEILRKSSGRLSPKELDECVPISNWQRYFSKIVECDDDYLKSRWNKLYELRCQVAHNANFSKADLEQVRQLISEVKPKIVDAIGKLPEIRVPAEEVEIVAESAAANVHFIYGQWLATWQDLEGVIMKAGLTSGIDTGRHSVFSVVQHLYQKGIIAKELTSSLLEIIKTRNYLVHGKRGEFSMEELEDQVPIMVSIAKTLIKTIWA